MPGNPPRRRALLAAGLLAGAAPRTAAGGGVRADAPGDPPWPRLAALALAPIRAAARALGGPGLLKSWVTDGTTDFDRTHAEAAYTYDNALAGLALLAAGDVALALRVAEGLRLAQAQDRHWRDGRLRNAYAAGRQHTDAPASARPPGWWDAAAGAWREDRYQVGSAAGPVAFAGLLWLACARAADDASWRAPAGRAADWLETLRAARGYRGGALGHEPAPDALAWTSTEQNLDCAVLFAHLGRTAAAAHARAFVEAMWLPAEARFAAGLTPEGAVNGTSALDANLWPALAWPDAARFRPALGWVLARHALPAGAPPDGVDGLDFDSDSDGIWLEGTAQAALLLRRAGAAARGEDQGEAQGEARARRLAATLRAHAGAGGWIRAASVPSLSTGFGTGLVPGAADFRYPDRGHLAANAWAALAALDASPFDP